MSDKDNSGPAFPFVIPASGMHGMEIAYGMTLRDYFAAQALVCVAVSGGKAFDRGEDFPPARAAKFAYQLADAMLAERAK